MPICLYFIIQIAYMHIQSDIVCVKYIVVIHTWYSVNYSIVRMLYIQPEEQVVTGIQPWLHTSSDCTYAV